jgi:hypothetical protein
MNNKERFNVEELKQIKNCLEKLNVDISNFKEIETELDAYKYIISSEFVNLLSKVIDDNNLHDIAFGYIEVARNISKNKIYSEMELIEDIVKIIIINTLKEN